MLYHYWQLSSQPPLVWSSHSRSIRLCFSSDYIRIIVHKGYVTITKWFWLLSFWIYMDFNSWRLNWPCNSGFTIKVLYIIYLVTYLFWQVCFLFSFHLNINKTLNNILYKTCTISQLFQLFWNIFYFKWSNFKCNSLQKHKTIY